MTALMADAAPLLRDTTWEIRSQVADIIRAQHDVRRLVEPFGPGIAYRAQLAAGELMANAAIHTRTPVIGIRVRDTGRAIRVEVRDDGSSDDVPQVKHPQPLAESGRGLFLVREYTSAWSQLGTTEGTVVWFEIDH